MLASDKLALSVLARFAGWPGESASWPVQVSFRLPLSLFAFCCQSFSSSFVTEVTSSTSKPPRFVLKCHGITERSSFPWVWGLYAELLIMRTFSVSQTVFTTTLNS